MAKKIIPLGKPNKLFVILSVVLAVALCVCIYFEMNMSSQTAIFQKVEFGSALQNSQAVYSDALGYTILGTYKNTVTAYDRDGKQIWNLDIAGSVSAMEYDTELDYVIVGSQDRNLYVIEAATGKLVNTITVSGRVLDIDYDQPTQRVLSMSSTNATKSELAVYDLLTSEQVYSKKFKLIANSAQFTQDAQHIVVGDNRANITVIDMATGEETFSDKLRDKIIKLNVAKESGDIVIVTELGWVARYDSEYNQVYCQQLVGEGYTVAVSADGKWTGVGMREGDVYILDEAGVQQYYAREGAQIKNIYFGPDLCYVVTLSTDLYEFSASKLDNIGSLSTTKVIVDVALYVLAALLIISLFVAVPRLRRLVQSFWRGFTGHLTAYAMLGVGIGLILVFNYYPVVQAFIYAFSDWSLATPTMRDVNFIGFDNFVKMVTEGYFLIGIKNMLIMMVCSFVKLLTVPVLLAELVYSMTATGKRRYWFRLILVMPMVVPGVVGTLMWGNIYDPNVGLLNNLFDLFGWERQVWLGDSKLALWCIIFMGFPWVNSMAFLIFYGGLVNIPTELFEAAKVDGSNRWWDLWHIKLPLITPQIKMMVITTFIGSIQDYGGILLLTDGGPGTSTYVPGLELYNNATLFGQYGYACALGLVMFVFILAGTIVNLRLKTQEIN